MGIFKEKKIILNTHETNTRRPTRLKLVFKRILNYVMKVIHVWIIVCIKMINQVLLLNHFASERLYELHTIVTIIVHSASF